MIITISRYNKYFGSRGRKKSIHEISTKLWETYFSQKIEKIFMNMSQIDKSSLWIERTCLKTCFKTLTSYRFHEQIWDWKTFLHFFNFCGVPNHFVESLMNEGSGVLSRALESPKTENWESLVNPLEPLIKKRVESLVEPPPKKTTAREGSK